MTACPTPPKFDDCTDLRGRSPVDPGIFKQSRTLILMVLGQSMWGNYGTCTLYAPAAGHVYEFNIWDQKIYPSDGGPVLSAGGGAISITPYLADMLIGYGHCARVLLVNLAIGSTSCADWDIMGKCYPRIQAALCQLNELGLQPNYCCVIQGHQDVSLGTTYDQFTKTRISMYQGIRAIGYHGSIISGLGCWAQQAAGLTSQMANVKAGQLQAALNMGAPNNVFAGIDDDTMLNNVSFRTDGVHWNDLGRFYTCWMWAQTFPIW